jgi:predicted nucleotide-binding protein
VILELGYAMAALGRRRVAILYQEGVEIPSDILGLAYYELDSKGAWKTKIAGELLAAGFDVDATQLLP